ncbi:cell division suppressor protein YneA [Niallia endozanthoxylica]|uniref:LysM peptidoglycan-binding domain-containing protein n=1 Tax=Niallia endozanthoxylica TaxID=2036016 RepID=A0A5J5HN92_9BACI|nr:LysM peptidoglycan-binding domain-containing protein [Niallia endozanthoxylica]KAA9021826.1 LysM peptidoglycan-binding domain-containing protein [Niallia endozanthoxylica]
MKKLWRNYSYAIILVALCMVSLVVIKINVPSSPSHYMTITVSAGQSLWEISQKYEEQHGLSEIEFIKWVEKYNGISGDNIFTGDNIIIPIDARKMEVKEVQNLASY